jgi:hypothetical protein
MGLNSYHIHMNIKGSVAIYLSPFQRDDGIKPVEIQLQIVFQ